MAFLLRQVGDAIPLIFGGHGYILDLTWVTVRVALVATAAATVVGLPIGAALGLARFRGRRILLALANASLALPSVVVGVFVLLLVLPRGALGGGRIAFTLDAVYLAQALLALPYIVALVPAAIRGVEPGLLAQARALGAGPVPLARLALREARIGVLAAMIAAFGASLAEVGAVVIVGGNIQGADQTLGSAVLQQVTDYADYPYAVGIGIVLLVLILVLMAALTACQQRANLRFRTT